MKRIAAGYYTTTVTTQLDGRDVSGLAEVVKGEGQSEWFLRLECDGKILLAGDDWMSTKAEATQVLRAVCQQGFETIKGLGIGCKAFYA